MPKTIDMDKTLDFLIQQPGIEQKWSELNDYQTDDFGVAMRGVDPEVAIASLLEALTEEVEKLEDISKPYTMETLPDRVKAMPKGAQRIWLGAFTSASEKYKDESRAFAIAQGAVNEKYEKVDGKWRLKKGDYQVPIVKYDDFRGLVYGVVLSPFDGVPTEDDVDTQQDVISKEETEAACHGFMLQGHRLDLQHKRDVEEDEAAVVECYINPVTYEADYGGETHTVKIGDWVMAVLLKTDKLKKQAQEGDIGFFSIRGKGMRQSVELGVEKSEEEAMTTLLELLNIREN